MPEEINTDTSECNQNDTSLQSCNRKSSVGKASTSGKTSRAENYSDEESDLHSDDEGLFGPESEDGANSKCDDLDDLEQSKIAPLFKALSISAEKSKLENSEEVQSESSGTGDYEWSSKSSSETYHEPTSDEDSTSEDESSADEENSNPLHEVLRTLTNPTDKNVNHKTNDTPNDDDCKRNGSYASYISDASENEKYNTTSRDDFQDGGFLIKRSPIRKSELRQPGQTPYTFNSPKRGYAVANISESFPASDSVPKLCLPTFPESFDHCIDDSYEKEWLSTDHIPIIWIDGVDGSQTQLTEAYAARMNSTDVSPMRSPEPWSCPFTSSTTSTNLSPNLSPKMGNDWPVQQLISSGSPVQNSDNSLLSYNSEMIEADLEKWLAEFTEDNHTLPNTDALNIDSEFSNIQNSNYETQNTPNEFLFTSDVNDIGANQSNFSTVFPNAVVNIKETPENMNVGRVGGCTKHQTEFEFHQSPSEMNYDNPSLYSTMPMQKPGIAFPTTTDPPQRNSPTTQIQDWTSVTNFGLTSMGHMIVNSSNEGSGKITASEQHDTNFQATTKRLDNSNKKKKSCKKNPNQEDLWMLLRLSFIPAVEILKQIISKEELHQAMHELLFYSAKQLAQQDELGNTHLMTIVRNETCLSSKLAQIAPLLSRMKKIPKSLTQTNELGHDALYLAAVKCPKFHYVTGILAALIAEACDDNNSNYWRRTYGEKRDTLMHVLAAKGDSHEAVLVELLDVQSASKRTLFDFSAKNIEGNTPFHAAVAAHNPSKTGISTVKIRRRLIEHGANPSISEDLNGNTALHMAMLTTCCEGIIEKLSYNTEGQTAATSTTMMVTHQFI